MKNKKIILLVILISLVGFIAGFFTSGRLARNRMKHMHSMMRDASKEKDMLVRKLELDSAQLKVISPWLDPMLTNKNEVIEGHKIEMDSLRQLMTDRLAPFLNDIQQEKLEKLKRKKRPGPPRP